MTAVSSATTRARADRMRGALSLDEDVDWVVVVTSVDPVDTVDSGVAKGWLRVLKDPSKNLIDRIILYM